MKKIFLTVLILVALSVLGYGVWYFLLRDAESVSLPPTVGENDPEGGVETVLPFSSLSVQGYWREGMSGNVYAISAEGKLVHLKKGGDSELLSPQVILNFQWLSENPSGEYVAIAFGPAGKEVVSVFSVAERTWYPLAEGVRRVAWHPTSGNLLAYFKESDGTSSLATLDLLTKKTTTILTLAIYDVEIDWVSPTELFVAEKPTSYGEGSLWVLNPSTKSLRRILGPRVGLASIWSKEDNAATIFFQGEKGYASVMIDRSGSPLAGATFQRTIREKCTLSDSFLVCAVPKEWPDGARLPDDYLKRKIYTVDDLWVWNRATNKATTLLSAGANSLDAILLKIADGALFFVNRYDGKLYTIKIGA